MGLKKDQEAFGAEILQLLNNCLHGNHDMRTVVGVATSYKNRFGGYCRTGIRNAKDGTENVELCTICGSYVYFVDGKKDRTRKEESAVLKAAGEFFNKYRGA